MPDVVVTVPRRFGLKAWIGEGDPAGSPWSGTYWGFSLRGRPRIYPGERVYVVCEGKLRGYAPLVEALPAGPGRTELVRAGGGIAVTLPYPVKGFRGYRYRWWGYSEEIPFPDWQTP